MASKMIGIEIGSDTLKLAVVSGGLVKTMAVERMPENLVREGKVTAPAAMSAFLKEMCKKNGIRGGNCAIVLPSQQVISHRVSMPAMSEAELKLNLPFEFRDFVGKDSAKYSYDYVITSVKDNTMELYAVAVRKDVVEDYYAILKKAGLTLKLAMPVEMAWQNLVMKAANEPKKVCIVDVGHNITRVGIYENGQFAMGREIEMGGQLLDETIADRQKVDPYVARVRKEANMDKVLGSDYCGDVYNALAMEIMKIISFYSYSESSEGPKLRDVYCCGGCSAIEGLRTAIIKSTELTMHHAKRLVPLGDVNFELTQYCALAAGAALQDQ